MESSSTTSSRSHHSHNHNHNHHHSHHHSSNHNNNNHHSSNRSSSSSQSSHNYGHNRRSTNDIFEVKEIVGMKKSGDTWLYRVRWKGYGPSEDTWEPANNLLNCRDMIHEYRRQQQMKQQKQQQQMLIQQQQGQMGHQSGSARKAASSTSSSSRKSTRSSANNSTSSTNSSNSHNGTSSTKHRNRDQSSKTSSPVIESSLLSSGSNAKMNSIIAPSPIGGQMSTNAATAYSTSLLSKKRRCKQPSTSSVSSSLSVSSAGSCPQRPASSSGSSASRNRNRSRNSSQSNSNRNNGNNNQSNINSSPTSNKSISLIKGPSSSSTTTIRKSSSTTQATPQKQATSSSSRRSSGQKSQGSDSGHRKRSQTGENHGSSRVLDHSSMSQAAEAALKPNSLCSTLSPTLIQTGTMSQLLTSPPGGASVIAPNSQLTIDTMAQNQKSPISLKLQISRNPAGSKSGGALATISGSSPLGLGSPNGGHPGASGRQVNGRDSKDTFWKDFEEGKIDVFKEDLYSRVKSRASSLKSSTSGSGSMTSGSMSDTASTSSSPSSISSGSMTSGSLNSSPARGFDPEDDPLTSSLGIIANGLQLRNRSKTNGTNDDQSKSNGANGGSQSGKQKLTLNLRKQSLIAPDLKGSSPSAAGDRRRQSTSPSALGSFDYDENAQDTGPLASYQVVLGRGSGKDIQASSGGGHLARDDDEFDSDTDDTESDDEDSEDSEDDMISDDLSDESDDSEDESNDVIYNFDDDEGEDEEELEMVVAKRRRRMLDEESGLMGHSDRRSSSKESNRHRYRLQSDSYESKLGDVRQGAHKSGRVLTRDERKAGRNHELRSNPYSTHSRPPKRSSATAAVANMRSSASGSKPQAPATALNSKAGTSSKLKTGSVAANGHAHASANGGSNGFKTEGAKVGTLNGRSIGGAGLESPPAAGTPPGPSSPSKNCLILCKKRALLAAIEDNDLELIDILIKSCSHGSGDLASGSAATGILAPNGLINSKMGPSRITPLMVACEKASPETVQYLLKRGARKDMIDINGNTALIYAAKRQSFDIVRALINQGANFAVINRYGVNALRIAKSCSLVDIHQYLTQHISQLTLSLEMQVTRMLSDLAKINHALFPIQCHALDEGSQFKLWFSFDHVKPPQPGVGHLLFIANCTTQPNDGEANPMEIGSLKRLPACRFSGTTYVSNVTLNGVPQKSLTEGLNSKFVFSFSPLVSGWNELIVTTTVNGQPEPGAAPRPTKLLLCAYAAQLVAFPPTCNGTGGAGQRDPAAC